MDINLNHYVTRLSMLREMLKFQVNEYKAVEANEQKQVCVILKYLIEEIINEKKTIRHFLSDEAFTVRVNKTQFNKLLDEFTAELIEVEKIVSEEKENDEICEFEPKIEKLPSKPTKDVTPVDSEIGQDSIIFNYDEVKAIQAIHKEFWINYNPKIDKKGVQQLVITDWITKNYPSINPSMAKFLDKIVRQKYIKQTFTVMVANPCISRVFYCRNGSIFHRNGSNRNA